MTRGGCWRPISRPCAIRGRHSVGVEFRFRHKDGTWRVLEALGSVLQYRSAGPQAVLTLRDVTEHRRAEAALRDSEERLRLTLEAGKCGIWDWDIPGNRVTWSERVYELHGLTPETFGGRSEDFLDAHPPGGCRPGRRGDPAGARGGGGLRHRVPRGSPRHGRDPLGLDQRSSAVRR